MESNGWIGLYRRLLDSEIMKHPAKCHLFIYCLLKASHQEHEGSIGHLTVPLEAGQFIFGRYQAARATGLSERSVRTCMTHLIRENRLESTTHSTKQFSIVTVCNWERYQPPRNQNDQPIDQAATNVRPSSDHRQKGIKGKQGIKEITTVRWTGKDFLVGSELRAKWLEAYPMVDIDKELAKATAWYLANPRRQKKAHARFLNNWLAKNEREADQQTKWQAMPETGRDLTIEEWAMLADENMTVEEYENATHWVQLLSEKDQERARKGLAGATA